MCAQLLIAFSFIFGVELGDDDCPECVRLSFPTSILFLFETVPSAVSVYWLCSRIEVSYLCIVPTTHHDPTAHHDPRHLSVFCVPCRPEPAPAAAAAAAAAAAHEAVAYESMMSDDDDQDGPSTLAKWLAVAGQCAFVAAFSLGVGPLAHVLSSELYPLRLRGVAVGTAYRVCMQPVIHHLFLSGFQLL